MSSIANILDKAADLIEPEGAWTQGAWIERRADRRCMCAEGALATAEHVEPSEAYEREATQFFFRWLRDSGEMPDPGSDIADWNDDPKRTQAEVVAKLREAASKARGLGK
jgi:hypothetical protein